MITLFEVIDMIAMTVIVGFIFKDMLSRFNHKPTHFDPIAQIEHINVSNFKFAIWTTAPAIILHELGHKFVAMLFGLSATFHAVYIWLGIGVILKLVGSGIIFFVPAFVSISGAATPLQYSAVAFAGPGVNLVLWLVAHFSIKRKLFHKKYHNILFLTSKINMFLFFFNMIPIGFFDGSKVFSGLIQHFF